MLFSNSLTKLHNSITYKFFKVLFMIYCIMIFVIAFMQMIVEYKNEKRYIVTQFEYVKNTISLSFKEDIMNLSEKNISLAMHNVILNPLIVGVRVKNTDKNVEWSLGDVPATTNLASNNNLSSISNYFCNIVLNDNKIGELYLYSNDLMIFDKIKYDFISILIIALIKIIIVWYLLLWGINKYILTPISNIVDNVQKIDVKNLTKLNLSPKISTNEIKILENHINYMIAILEDYLISNNKIKRSLELSENYLSDVFDSMPSILISVNSNNIITHWNKQAKDVFGYSVAEAVGKKINELIGHVLGDNIEMIDLAFNEQKVFSSSKFKCNINSKEYKHFKVIVYPLNFSTTEVVIRMDDISDQMEIESLMVQNEKMASLGTLAAGMAHEINNPLGGIIQSIQNIQRRLEVDLEKNKHIAEKHHISLELINEYLDERGINQFLSGVKDLAERSATIVRNVLKFGRKSDSLMSLANINELVKETISILSTDYEIKKQVSFKKMQISHELHDDLPEIYCIANEIEQVLLNLMRNAAHALSDKISAEQKLLYIKVSTLVEGNFIKIIVEDNGPGIPQENHKNLFEPFFTTKPVGVGTGLGLSISYYIVVEKHHGRLDFETEIGKGTKFIMEIPIKVRD